MAGQPRKINYTALQRRAMLAADLETGGISSSSGPGHAEIHLQTFRALRRKGLITFKTLGCYVLTELGRSEAKRLQAERGSKTQEG